jgi:type IV secretion system protein TrbE
MINLREYRQRQKYLADYLPWACLVASGVVLNKDGSFQRTARFRGPDLSSSTGESLVSICARINNVLKRYGSGWALYFEATREPAHNYPESDWRDPVAWLIDEERRNHFAAAGELFESAYFVTIAFLPPTDSMSRMGDLFVETPAGAKTLNADDYLSRFINETDKCLDLLKGVMPEARFLTDDETLTYLQASVSPKRHRVKAPDVPAYLDAVLGGADLVGGLEPMLGGKHLRVLSIQGFPAASEPGLLDELNNLGFSYRWMTRYLPMDKADATKTLGRYRRQWFAKRKSLMAMVKEVMTNEASALVDTDADNKAADSDAALQALGDDIVGFGYVTTAIVVSHADATTADAMLREIDRIINGRGFVTITESVNAVEAWLGTIPGHAYANIRQPIIHSLNLAHMMPLSAVWAGPEKNDHLNAPPLLCATTGTHTPFRLVTHQGDVGHSIVVGPTGAGKSVFLAVIAAQFRRYENAQVFFFDKGRSAQAITAGIGGDHYALGEDSRLCFQPLGAIDDENERSWALEWVTGLLAHEGISVEPDVKERVWTALTSLSTAPVKERTMTGLSVLLQSNKLKQTLQPYTLAGAHGALLDADCETLDAGDWQCFEMEALMHQKSLVLPVLTYLFHRLEARFDGKPTMLILDEAWVFLDDPLFAGRIREWLKVLRKRNVSVVFATQSLSDIANSAIAPAIIESCPSRIFLPNDRALEPQQRTAYEAFGLNTRQVEIIAQAIPCRDYYFQSRAGNRLFDLELGPVALAFCAASSKDDLRLIDDIGEAHGNDFAAPWLRARGLAWVADLIIQHSTSAGEVRCAAE